MTYDADARWWQNRANRAEARAERAETINLLGTATLLRVRDLHKRQTRYSPMEDLEFSFDTFEEATDYGEGDVHSFDVCAHCGEIEMRQAADFGDYLEALWPCATIRALDGEASDA